MSSYPLISEHGLIGDLQTAALVSTGGTVDWLCLPRFDSPSVFASLLDADRGGRFRIAPEGTNHVAKQLYFPDTAVLITRFMSPDGVGEVADFMPVDDPHHASVRHQLIRVLRVVRGQMTFILECQPRFDYGRAEHRLRAVGDGFIFETDEMDLALRATVELQPDGSDVRAMDDASRRRRRRDPRIGSRQGGAAPIDAERVLSRFNETVRFWRGWLGRSTYTGRWREAISRSAMTLKLMTYAPTGARGRSHDEPARAGRWRAQLGLPVHGYATRRFPFTRCSVSATRTRRWPSSAGCGIASARGPGRPRGRSRSCTGSTDRPTFTRRRWITSKDIGDRRLCTLGTVLRISCSSTSTARRWTPCTARVGKGDARSRGMAGRLHDDGLAGRALGRARGGDLGDARRARTSPTAV